MSVRQEIEFFVDTNILVYAYDRSAGNKHATAVDLMRGWWGSENACISIQVLQEFYVTVTRKIVSRIDHLTARQIVADLGHWRVHNPAASDLLEAIDFQQHYRLSFWDAMVLQSATRLGCQQILTEDLSHGQKYGNVQAANPFLRPN